MNDPHLNKTFGDVRLTDAIGQGAMGSVYRGHHTKLNRNVAVKLLQQKLAKGNAKERFLREGLAASKVEHPNVVQVLDAGEQDGIAYLVMELVSGSSLGKILEEREILPADTVVHIAQRVARGLAAIHEKGIIHRDVKPDNILISVDQQVKITDLGLAKQTDDPDLNRLTATGMVVGTPLYVSPESIRHSQSATTAADIYSLGITMYHMLTGAPPFNGLSPYEVMRSHLETQPKALRTIRSDIPPGLAALVERCLAKDPKKRPTALEVAEILKHGANIPTTSSAGLLVLVLIATVIIAGLAIGGWFFWQHTRQAQHASDVSSTAPSSFHSDTRGPLIFS